MLLRGVARRWGAVSTTCSSSCSVAGYAPLCNLNSDPTDAPRSQNAASFRTADSNADPAAARPVPRSFACCRRGANGNTGGRVSAQRDSNTSNTDTWARQTGRDHGNDMHGSVSRGDTRYSLAAAATSCRISSLWREQSRQQHGPTERCYATQSRTAGGLPQGKALPPYKGLCSNKHVAPPTSRYLKPPHHARASPSSHIIMIFTASA